MWKLWEGIFRSTTKQRKVCSPLSKISGHALISLSLLILGLKKAAPKLQEIHLCNNYPVCLSCILNIYGNSSALKISLLGDFKGITTFHLDIHVESQAEADIPNDIANALATPPPVVEDAKRYLSKSTSKSPKFLKVIYKVRDFQLEDLRAEKYHRPEYWRVAKVQDFEL